MTELIVLTFMDYYRPGFKAGGPIRTITNLVNTLEGEVSFKIITSDRDILDTKPYSGIKINDWNRLDHEEVFYISPKKRSLRQIRKIILSTEYDVLYLNSFFSINFTVKPLLLKWLNLLPNKPIILAPRGQFSPGAFSLKRVKKQVYLWIAKKFSFFRGVVWQASSVYEEVDIRRWFGEDVQVLIAPNLPPMGHEGDELLQKSEKSEGSLKIVFLSRISRKKNLDSALKTLKELNGKVKFNIYGPMEDKNYWKKCEKILVGIPSNIKIQYYGAVDHDEVHKILSANELFFLPTMGENFGHVILEALCAGCPVLISDKTPWRDLEEKGVGWDLPLDRPDLFQEVLQRCIDMNNYEYLKWSKKAQEYGRLMTKDDEVVEMNRKLFSMNIFGD